MAVEWLYLHSDGKLDGPVSSERLRELAALGFVRPGTPVQRMSQDRTSPWRHAGAIKGLFAFDASNQVGGPICEACGILLLNDRCLRCSPVAAPPIEPPLPPPADDGFFLASGPAASEAARGNRRTDDSWRYPHLRGYLELSQNIASAALIISVVVAVIGLLVAIGNTTGDRVGLYLLGASLGLLAVFMGWLATMAGVELIRVLLDIESNTRHLAEREPQ